MTFRGKEITPPLGIRSEAFVIRPVRTADVELDYAAVMESREFLRTWEQSTWPEDDFTVAANLEDLEKLVNRHSTGEAFAYTVMSPDETECFGCIYISPPEVRWFNDAEITPVSSARWSDIEAMISFWIRKSRLGEEMDRQVLDAIRAWFEDEWAFGRYVISTNEQFLQQVAMIEGTDLALQFEIKLPGSSGKDLAYA